MALKGLKHNSTVIHVKPGTYILKLGQETNITDRYMVAITGSGEKDTVIKCAPSVGLWFIASNESRANLLLGHLKPKQTFIAGGGVISFSFYISMDYINITESHIVNNHMKIFQSVFSHKYKNVNLDLAGGIALFYFSSHGQVLIDSCSIINNTMGLVLIDLAGDYLVIRVTVNIKNTQYSNHSESTILAVKNYDSQSSLQLLYVNKSGQLVIYSDSNERYS